MTPDYQQKIDESKKAGFTDEEIFNKMKTLPEFSEKYAQSQQAGVPDKETDSFIKSKYHLNAKAPKTFLQNVYSALSYNPVAHAIEAVAGKNPVSDSLQEAQRSLVTGGTAAAMSLLTELTHLPENILKSGEQYRKDHPEKEKEFDPRDYIVDSAMKGADWVLDKIGAKEKAAKIFPTFNQALELLRPEEEAPKTHVGKATERVSAGLGVGGPIGAVVGLADYLGENVVDMSPEQRAIMSLMVARTGPKQPKTVYGKLLPKEPITGVNDLAARLITSNPENLNVSTLKAAYDLNMPIENIPLQALYKQGLPNLIEGISQNSLLGTGKFNKLLDNFTFEMTNRIEKVIDSMPLDEGAQAITSKEQIGEPTFVNTLPEIFEQAAPQLNVPKHETGKIGTNLLAKYDQEITEKYKELYNQVTFTENDILNPISADYKELKNTVNSVEKKLSSKGFKGAERKEALSVLKEVKKLFEKEKKFDMITGIKLKEKAIKLEDIRKNIIDLNKKISYENPTLVNLLEPVATKMRSIMEIEASRSDNLKPLIEANNLFREKAQFFQDPIIKKLLNMTDEQFYRAIRNNPSSLRRFSEFAEQTGQTEALNDLKGKILADVLEKPLKATSPREMVSAINDKVIKEIRELEPFYPELRGLSTGLENFRKQHAEHLTPQSIFKSKIRQQILEDIMSDSDFSQTLKMMNTPKGIDLVRETLGSTNQGKQLLKTLERKKVAECLYKGPQKQEISLLELGEAFNDTKTNLILKKLLSAENYKQAKNLSKIAENYEKGLKSHKELKGKFEKGVGLGIIPGMFFSPIKTSLGVGAMAYSLLSKNFKKAMIENSKRQYEETTKQPKKEINPT